MIDVGTIISIAIGAAIVGFAVVATIVSVAIDR